MDVIDHSDNIMLTCRTVLNMMATPEYSRLQQFVISILDGLQLEPCAGIVQGARLFTLRTDSCINKCLMEASAAVCGRTSQQSDSFQPKASLITAITFKTHNDYYANRISGTSV